MLRLSAIHAKPGMQLAMPVLHPKHPSTILLKAGATLEPHVIARLQQFGIDELWIAYPGLEQIAECVSQEVCMARAALTSVLAEPFDQARTGVDPQLDYRVFRRAVVDLIDRLADYPHSAFYIQEMNGCGSPMLRFATNVAYIAVLIGLKLDFYLEHQRSRLDPARARDVSPLGVGTLLRDIGYMRLDPEVIQRYLATHDESDPPWQQHTQLGFDIVRGEVDPSAAAVVLHHHQRFDGSGFPRQMTGTGLVALHGTAIHVFARIAAAAELYESLRLPLAPDDIEAPLPLPPVRVLRLMQQQPYSDWIDPVIFLGLCAVVPPYAPGSIVELSNGVRGVVVQWRPADPCRPVVREIGNLNDPDQYATGEQIDLNERRDLCVVLWQDQDVRDENFYPSETLRFDLPGIARAMINRASDLNEPPLSQAS
ncbi:MAG: hypothetical protein KF757_00270 [Phycisphaeraceae bacterium]|nr:hypothetical protein [Phycisphaeraceae bacterium]MCW5761642.1 hypothetical protein [Phycisphaeraceae bacterium]